MGNEISEMPKKWNCPSLLRPREGERRCGLGCAWSASTSLCFWPIPIHCLLLCLHFFTCEWDINTFLLMIVLLSKGKREEVSHWPVQLLYLQVVWRSHQKALEGSWVVPALTCLPRFSSIIVKHSEMANTVWLWTLIHWAVRQKTDVLSVCTFFKTKNCQGSVLYFCVKFLETH